MSYALLAEQGFGKAGRLHKESVLRLCYKYAINSLYLLGTLAPVFGETGLGLLYKTSTSLSTAKTPMDIEYSMKPTNRAQSPLKEPQRLF